MCKCFCYHLFCLQHSYYQMPMWSCSIFKLCVIVKVYIYCFWSTDFIRLCFHYFTHNTIECHFFELFFLTTHNLCCHLFTFVGNKLSMWWIFFVAIMCWHQSCCDHGLINFLFKCVHFVVIKCPWSFFVFKLSHWQLVHILLLISRFHETGFPIFYTIVHGLSFLRIFLIIHTIYAATYFYCNIITIVHFDVTTCFV
jgi:hypothetical protein